MGYSVHFALYKRIGEKDNERFGVWMNSAVETTARCHHHKFNIHESFRT